MRYGLIGDNPIESALIASGLLPASMLDGYAMVNTRALLVAAKAGIFDALADGPADARQVADKPTTP